MEAQSIYDLWHWAWLAAIIVGVLVWGLIFWAVIRYWRRSETEIPVQTRYNLPIEILYTVAPGRDGDRLLLLHRQGAGRRAAGRPGHARRTPITVVGQQWSWTFNYDKDDAINGVDTVYEGGTTADRPTLWLPVDQSVRFNLCSPDVIHSFWVPAFLFKMDVVPGRDNNFSLTPTVWAPTTASAPSSAASTTRGCSSTSRSSPRTGTQRTSRPSRSRATPAWPRVASEVNEQPGLKSEDGGTE